MPLRHRKMRSGDAASHRSRQRSFRGVLGKSVKNPYMKDFSHANLCLRLKVCGLWKGIVFNIGFNSAYQRVKHKKFFRGGTNYEKEISGSDAGCLHDSEHGSVRKQFIIYFRQQRSRIHRIYRRRQFINCGSFRRVPAES
jgi:hypothetical protein